VGSCSELKRRKSGPEDADLSGGGEGETDDQVRRKFEIYLGGSEESKRRWEDVIKKRKRSL